MMQRPSLVPRLPRPGPDSSRVWKRADLVAKGLRKVEAKPVGKDRADSVGFRLMSGRGWRRREWFGAVGGEMVELQDPEFKRHMGTFLRVGHPSLSPKLIEARPRASRDSQGTPHAP